LQVSRKKGKTMSAAIGKKSPKGVVAPSVAPRKKSQQLGLNAKRVVSKRYSLKDSKGRAIEEWADIVRRVVGHVSAAERDAEKRDQFFAAMSEVMLDREFLPNTPCLVNAGKTNGQLAACFVLEVPDSLNGIMDHAKLPPPFIKQVAAPE
jgi:ribonucleoside-diphosphate reductase alpha chain